MATVLKSVDEDFLAAWAELEVNNKYIKPILAINEGLTHPSSPVPGWLQLRITNAAALKERVDKLSK